MRPSLFALASILPLLSVSQGFADTIDFRDIRLAPPDAHLPSNLVILQLPQPGEAVEIPTDVMFKDLVGRGYDPIRQKITAYTCVADAGNDDKFGFGKQEGTEFHSVTRSVSSIDTKESASTSEASFGFAYKAFGLGVSGSSSRADFFNSVDSYGSLYAYAKTQGQERARGKWNPTEEHKLHNDMSAFLSECGTMYVEAISLGHILNDTIHFTSTGKGSLKDNAVALHASVAKLFSLGGGTASNEKEVQDQSTNFNLIEGKGVFGIPSIPSDHQGGVDKLIEFADTGFAAAVKSDTSNDQAVPLTITVQPYKDDGDLPGRRLVPTWTFGVEQLFIDNLSLFTRLQAAASELYYAVGLSADQKQFAELYVEDQPTAKQKKMAADALLKAVKDASDACEKLLQAGKEKGTLDACTKGFADAISDDKVAAVELHRQP